MMCRTVVTLPFLYLVSLSLAGNAWFTQFKASQELWIGPGVPIGTGAGTPTDPFSFTSAAAKQNGEGKLYWLLPGNYTSGISTRPGFLLYRHGYFYH